MTIEKAKTKLCPFQEYDYQNKQFCLADMCMAWVETWDNGVPAPEDETNTGYCGRLRIR